MFCCNVTLHGASGSGGWPSAHGCVPFRCCATAITWITELRPSMPHDVEAWGPVQRVHHYCSTADPYLLHVSGVAHTPVWWGRGAGGVPDAQRVGPLNHSGRVKAAPPLPRLHPLAPDALPCRADMHPFACRPIACSALSMPPSSRSLFPGKRGDWVRRHPEMACSSSPVPVALACGRIGAAASHTRRLSTFVRACHTRAQALLLKAAFFGGTTCVCCVFAPGAEPATRSDPAVGAAGVHACARKRKRHAGRAQRRAGGLVTHQGQR